MTADEEPIRHDAGEPTLASPPPYLHVTLDLSDTEQKVLFIAKDLMQKHYLLDLKDLYSQAMRSLKDFKPFAIQQAIDGLCRKKILFGGSAITRDTLLDNETRRAIFDVICKHPGIHFSAIKRRVDKDSRTLMIHLRVLERFEMIRAENFNNSKAYFDFFLPKGHDSFYFHLQKDKVHDILAAIMAHPGISLATLASIIGDAVPNSTFYRKIKVMLENNMLSARYDDGKIVGLDIPPELLPILDRVLFK
ncbi:MAG: hypothetical protein GYA24_05085 [Candidatus Lokiarchaeota archaeon]|nr:hypothetical protein [Candidatus Lokiarchaeota archaeon]